jgi:hypothetical protein
MAARGYLISKIRNVQGKERRRVGRPVAYRGDPDAPELTEKERRRIKRRIANRESAQRVRHRRQEELEEMQIKVNFGVTQKNRGGGGMEVAG